MSHSPNSPPKKIHHWVIFLFPQALFSFDASSLTLFHLGSSFSPRKIRLLFYLMQNSSSVPLKPRLCTPGFFLNGVQLFFPNCQPNEVRCAIKSALKYHLHHHHYHLYHIPIVTTTITISSLSPPPPLLLLPFIGCSPQAPTGTKAARPQRTEMSPLKFSCRWYE